MNEFAIVIVGVTCSQCAKLFRMWVQSWDGEPFDGVCIDCTRRNEEQFAALELPFD